MSLLPLESPAKAQQAVDPAATVELRMTDYPSEEYLFAEANQIRAERLSQLGLLWNCWISYDASRAVMILDFQRYTSRT